MKSTALSVDVTVTGTVCRLVHATASPTSIYAVDGWKPLSVIVISVVFAILVLVGDAVALAVADAALGVVIVVVGVSEAGAVAPGAVGAVVPVVVMVDVGLVIAVASGVTVLVAVASGVDVGEELSPSTTIAPAVFCTLST